MAVRRPSSPTGRRKPTFDARTLRRCTAILATGLVAGTAIAMMPGGGANASPTPVSQAAGRFLSGAIGGSDLDNLIAVKGESAMNTGGPSVTHQHSLSASLLNHQLLNLPDGLQLPGGGVLELGAVDQYARANPDGSAHGASGAVTNSGAVGLGGGSAPQSDATLDLAGASGLASLLGDVKASVGALAATADQKSGKNGAQSGDYELASLELQLTSPALASAIKLLSGGSSQVPGLSDLISTLAGAGLPVSALEAVGTNSSTVGLTKALTSLGDVNFGDGAITGSLTAGTLTIDLAKLIKSTLNLDLNNLPANTHLIAYVAGALPKALNKGLEQLASQLTAAFDKLSLAGSPLPAGGSEIAKALKMLLAPLTEALSSGAEGLSSTLFVPMAKQLQQLIDLVVNVQESSQATFTERALRIDLIGDPAVRLNLASASVGPGTGAAAPSPTPSATPTESGSSDPGPGPSSSHSGAGGGAPASSGSAQQLASTGVTTTLTKIALFGLLGLCLGAALYGATIGIRRPGQHGI
jgi:hypothetical protein